LGALGKSSGYREAARCWDALTLREVRVPRRPVGAGARGGVYKGVRSRLQLRD
jgi:hypothetical protein